MADLMTPTEVVALAFQRPIAVSRIEDALINAIQVRYILPILGEDFYDAVVADAASYTALVAYLKPIIAYYVRYQILPDVFTDVANTGVNRIPGNNRVPGTSDDLGSLKQSALETAMMYVSAMTKYLDDNYTDYPLYYPGANPDNRVQISGGIIHRNVNIDDFYNNTND